MEIKKEHFIDAGQKDADGFYDYYYEGDIYEIIFPDVIYNARTYTDTPTEISFLSKTIAGKRKSLRHADMSIPYEDKNFRQCVEHLKKVGFQHFKMLRDPEGIYESIELEKFVK